MDYIFPLIDAGFQIELFKISISIDYLQDTRAKGNNEIGNKNVNSY